MKYKFNVYTKEIIIFMK